MFLSPSVESLSVSVPGMVRLRLPPCSTCVFPPCMVGVKIMPGCVPLVAVMFTVEPLCPVILNTAGVRMPLQFISAGPESVPSAAMLQLPLILFSCPKSISLCSLISTAGMILTLAEAIVLAAWEGAQAIDIKVNTVANAVCCVGCTEASTGRIQRV